MVPKDAWWAMSQDLSIPVRLPLRPEVAAYQYPAGESIVCGKLPNGDREFYVLSAINNKIAEYPRFADAIGIRCVRDCATARPTARATIGIGRSTPASMPMSRWGTSVTCRPCQLSYGGSGESDVVWPSLMGLLPQLLSTPRA